MNLPEMHYVSSSNVESVGYDEETSTLYVSFLTGFLYTYLNVPIVVFNQLLHAPSVGGYLNANIKGVYLDNRIK
ncbi:MAG: KTSC domain-containing protein [Bacteroidia bacterium]|jgi:hypothetical protein|nr:KTSC domain-containing protein [Bacteroidia bacterium]